MIGIVNEWDAVERPTGPRKGPTISLERFCLTFSRISLVSNIPRPPSSYLDKGRFASSVFSQHDDDLRVGEAAFVDGQLELLAQLLPHVGI